VEQGKTKSEQEKTLDGLAWLWSGLVLTDDIAMTLILDVSLLFPSSVTIFYDVLIGKERLRQA